MADRRLDASNNRLAAVRSSRRRCRFVCWEIRDAGPHGRNLDGLTPGITTGGAAGMLRPTCRFYEVAPPMTALLAGTIRSKAALALALAVLAGSANPECRRRAGEDGRPASRVAR